MAKTIMAWEYQEKWIEKIFFMFLDADIRAWVNQQGSAVHRYPITPDEVQVLRDNARRVVEMYCEGPTEPPTPKEHRTMDLELDPQANGRGA
jgi:hypothetical protein